MENREIAANLDLNALEILSIKVMCTKCNNVWGIGNNNNISSTKFRCLACLEKKEIINEKENTGLYNV